MLCFELFRRRIFAFAQIKKKVESVLVLLPYISYFASTKAQKATFWGLPVRNPPPVVCFPPLPLQRRRAGFSKHGPGALKYECRGNRKVCIPPLAMCPNTPSRPTAPPEFLSLRVSSSCFTAPSVLVFAFSFFRGPLSWLTFSRSQTCD